MTRSSLAVLAMLLLLPSASAQQQDPVLTLALESTEEPGQPGESLSVRGMVQVTADALSPRLADDGLRITLVVLSHPAWAATPAIEPAEIVLHADAPTSPGTTWRGEAQFGLSWNIPAELATCETGVIQVEAILDESTMTYAKHAIAEMAVSATPPGGCERVNVTTSGPAPPAENTTEAPAMTTPSPTPATTPSPAPPVDVAPAADRPLEGDDAAPEEAEVPATVTGAVLAIGIAALALRRRR